MSSRKVGSPKRAGLGKKLKQLNSPQSHALLSSVALADSQPWLQPLPPFSGQELGLLKVTDNCDFNELAQAYWDDEVRQPNPPSYAHPPPAAIGHSH